MEIARAVILATPAADEQPWSSVGAGPKPLARVATRPVIFHTLDALRAAGVLEAALVTDAASAPRFRAAVGDGADWGMTMTYAEANSGTDVCGAVGAAERFIGGEPVLVHHADALLEDRLRGDIVAFGRERLDALTLTVPQMPDRPSGMAACWLFSADAVSSLLEGPSLADPLFGLRRDGARVRTLAVAGCLACHGGESSLLRANRHLLQRLRSDYSGAELEECEIQGPVVIHPTAALRRCLVRGPAIIGAGARLVDAYVGPYTSVGANTRLVGTEIEHSIVLEEAELLNVGSRLETSIIGRGASIVRRFETPRAVRLSIGDGAEIALS